MHAAFTSKNGRQYESCTKHRLGREDWQTGWGARLSSRPGLCKSWRFAKDGLGGSASLLCVVGDADYQHPAARAASDIILGTVLLEASYTHSARVGNRVYGRGNLLSDPVEEDRLLRSILHGERG